MAHRNGITTMGRVDIDAANRFLTLLDEQAEGFTFQCLDDSGQGRSPLARVFNGSLTQWRAKLEALNRNGAGVFVAVNETDLNGRKRENVRRVRAVWADLDSPEIRPEWPLEPHIVVESSPGKQHVYWLCEGLEMGQFGGIMARVASYGADPAATDLARVLRLPGFYHRKGEPQLVRIISESGAKPYTADEITRAFPPINGHEYEPQYRTSDETEEIDEQTHRQLTDALTHLDANEYAEWVNIGIALKTLGERGFALWDAWSWSSESRKEADPRAKWDTFKPERTSWKSVFKKAQAKGWRPKTEQEHNRPPKPPPRTQAPPDLDHKQPGKPEEYKPPIINVSDLLRMEFEDPLFAIDKFVPEGVTLIAGPPKIGKTWFVMGMSIAVASGGKAFGKIDVELGEVLHLALEDTKRRFKSRLEKLNAYQDAPWSKNISFCSEWRRFDNHGVGDLVHWLEAHPGARLVVIDTLKRVRPRAKKNESLYDSDYAVGELLAPLIEKYRVAIVIVHHTRKSEAEDPHETISGSFGLTGGMDGSIVIQRSRGQYDAEVHVTGRDIDEEKYGFTFKRDTGEWILEGEGNEVTNTKARQQVLDAVIALRAASPVDITRFLYGEKKSGRSNEAAYVRRHLQQLKQLGDVYVDGGLYRYTHINDTHDTHDTQRTQDTHDTQGCVSMNNGSDTQGRYAPEGTNDEGFGECVSSVSRVSLGDTQLGGTPTCLDCVNWNPVRNFCMAKHEAPDAAECPDFKPRKSES